MFTYPFTHSCFLVPASSPAEVQEAAANILDLVKTIVPADDPTTKAKLDQITQLTQEVVAKGKHIFGH